MKKEIPSNPNHKEGHYSNGRGHRERSLYWNGLRRLYPTVEGVPAEIAWIVKRVMLQDPRSGK